MVQAQSEWVERLRPSLPPEGLDGLDYALGPDGPGTFYVPDVLDEDQIALAQAEIFDPACVQWRDNHHSFVNARDLTIVENHDVFALKARIGDQRWLDRVPRLQTIAAHLEALVRSQSDAFPVLADWGVDELSLHRYDNPEVGLSRHKDNLRFWGVIVVLTLEGESDFVTWDDHGCELVIAAKAGGLILNRATDLYEVARDAEGKKVNLCPDHAVVNVRTPRRTSLILRDNKRPNDPVPGFEYDNWPIN